MKGIPCLLLLLSVSAAGDSTLPPEGKRAAWVGRCAARLEVAQAAFERRFPSLAGGAVRRFPGRGADYFLYRSSPLQSILASATEQAGSPDQPWTRMAASVPADFFLTRTAGERRAAMTSVALTPEQVQSIVETFQPALDACLEAR